MAPLYIKLCRNQAMTSGGEYRPPKATSTGTTIVGLIYAVRLPPIMPFSVDLFS